MMNWHYDTPILNGQYLCCVKDYSFPIPLNWYDGDWGDWNKDGDGEWILFDSDLVVCYTSFQEIPMPEGW